MKKAQQELPLRQRGGKRKGAGRKRKATRRQVPHRPREKFRNGALHVTVRMRKEVWNLRTHRCFRAIRQAFELGCRQAGFRLVHFSVQGNHIHLIVEAADPQALARAMKGLEVRMARALNRVMKRRGAVFADRYHSHVLKAPREAAHAVRYVLQNHAEHARREGWLISQGVDPYSSVAEHDPGPPMIAKPVWWMLCVGVPRASPMLRAA